MENLSYNERALLLIMTQFSSFDVFLGNTSGIDGTIDFETDKPISAQRAEFLAHVIVTHLQLITFSMITTID